MEILFLKSYVSQQSAQFRDSAMEVVTTAAKEIVMRPRIMWNSDCTHEAMLAILQMGEVAARSGDTNSAGDSACIGVTPERAVENMSPSGSASASHAGASGTATPTGSRLAVRTTSKTSTAL